MSSVASSLMTSMTSSTVMTPTSLFSSSTTGNREQVVRRDLPRHFLLVHVDAGADEVRGHDPLQRRLRRHQQQPPQRDHADQVAALVDDVEVEHHLDVAVALQLGDGLADRHVFVEREDMRVHDAAGGLLVVLEQVLDDARFLRAASDRAPPPTAPPAGSRSGPPRRRRESPARAWRSLRRSAWPAARRPPRDRAPRPPPWPAGRCGRPAG